MANDNLLKMAQFISELRKEKKLTQKELAEQLGVTDKAVSKWERGLSYPDISLLPKLSYVLGITISELLNGKKTEPSNPEVEAMVEKTLKYASTATKSAAARSMVWKYVAMASAIILSGILILIGCSLVIEKGLGWAVLPVSIVAFIWIAAISVLFVTGKNKIGSILLCGFFIYMVTLYYSFLNQTPIRDIEIFNGFPKEYISHYTVILVMFIVSITLTVVSFLIQKKRIHSDKIFLLVAVSITIIILSILTVSSIMDYVDINFLGVDARFTILLLLTILINFVSLTLLAIRQKRQIGQTQKKGN